MRSPGSAPARLEGALRGAALLLLLWLLWGALRPALAPSAPPEVAGPASDQELRATLARWTTDEAPPAAHVALRAAPLAAERDWLRAVRGAGTALGWRIASPVALAVQAEPVPAPRGGTAIAVAAPDDTRAVIGDEGGLLDTLAVARTGAALVSPAPAARIGASVGAQRAEALVVDSLLLRPVLLLGRAGWEGKFVLTALEERGWRVDARLAVAPGVAVTQGRAPIRLDTARYSAVVVLDSSAAPEARAIARFVHEGGGAVLAGTAALAPTLAAIAPARIGAYRAPRPVLAADSVGLRTLGLFPLERLTRDAAVLARHRGAAAVAARRVGAGRVVQTGYDETWRWRMTGGEGAPAAHRAWWSALVGDVAYAPAVSLASFPVGDAAPLAALVGALGEPAPAPRAPVPLPDDRSRAWIAAALLLLLLAEWTSRRLRGQA